MRRRWVKTIEVEVDIDMEHVLNAMEGMDDDELAQMGLSRITPRNFSPWREIRAALLRGDQARVQDLMSDLAWREGGVILPCGTPLVH